METSEKTQRHGGIYNYFEGATINNLVINGTMNKNGTEHYYGAEVRKQTYSDRQIARAIEAICGEGLPVDSKQKWAAVYWYLRWACNFPVKAQDFCERIKILPFSKPLVPQCDYNNIRRLATLSFMGQDARQLDSVKPSKSDEPFFMQCRMVVTALEQELYRNTDLEM